MNFIIKFSKSILFLFFFISSLHFIHAQIKWDLDTDFIAGVSASTYLPNSQVVVFCNGQNMMYYPMSSQNNSEWASVSGFSKIDAALNYFDQQILFFQGAFYQSMDLQSGELSGTWTPWPGLPLNWNNQLDAVVNWAPGTFVFFKGLEFGIYDSGAKQFIQTGLVSDWNGWPNHWNDGFNASLNIDGIIYFFRGDEIMAFDQKTQTFSTASPSMNPIVSGNSAPAIFPEKKTTSEDSSVHPMFGSQDSEEESTEEIVTNVFKHDEKIHGKYRFDYEDFEEGYRQDKAFTGNSGNLKVAGYDWLGTGIDITKYNPIFPTRSWRADHGPIIPTLSSKTGGNRGSDLLPWGTVAKTRSSTQGSVNSQWIKSYQEFVNTFKINGSANIGIGKPGQKIAGANFSGSFQEMIQKKIGSEALYHVQKKQTAIYNLTMQLDWRERGLGFCRQRMSTAFQDDIKNLSASPSDEDCKKIIEKYGTHIAVGLQMGGIHLVITEVEKSVFEDTRMTESQFKAKAAGTIKKVSVGASVEFMTREKETDGGATRTMNRQVDVVGASGISDLREWEKELKNDPVATIISMVPLTEIISKKFFPLDEDIIEKNRALKIAIKKYIKENTLPPPPKTKYNFFDVKNHMAASGPRKTTVKEKSGKIIIKNTSHYAIRANITYQLNGKMKSYRILDVHHGQSGQRTIPSGATDIQVSVLWKDGFAEFAEFDSKEYPKNGDYTITVKGALLQPPYL